MDFVKSLASEEDSIPKNNHKELFSGYFVESSDICITPEIKQDAEIMQTFIKNMEKGLLEINNTLAEKRREKDKREGLFGDSLSMLDAITTQLQNKQNAGEIINKNIEVRGKKKFRDELNRITHKIAELKRDIATIEDKSSLGKGIYFMTGVFKKSTYPSLKELQSMIEERELGRNTLLDNYLREKGVQINTLGKVSFQDKMEILKKEADAINNCRLSSLYDSDMRDKDIESIKNILITKQSEILQTKYINKENLSDFLGKIESAKEILSKRREEEKVDLDKNIKYQEDVLKNKLKGILHHYVGAGHDRAVLTGYNSIVPSLMDLQSETYELLFSVYSPEQVKAMIPKLRKISKHDFASPIYHISHHTHFGDILEHGLVSGNLVKKKNLSGLATGKGGIKSNEKEVYWFKDNIDMQRYGSGNAGTKLEFLQKPAQKDNINYKIDSLDDKIIFVSTFYDCAKKGYGIGYEGGNAMASDSVGYYILGDDKEGTKLHLADIPTMLVADNRYKEIICTIDQSNLGEEQKELIKGKVKKMPIINTILEHLEETLGDRKDIVLIKDITKKILDLSTEERSIDTIYSIVGEAYKNSSTGSDKDGTLRFYRDFCRITEDVFSQKSIRSNGMEKKFFHLSYGSFLRGRIQETILKYGQACSDKIMEEDKYLFLYNQGGRKEKPVGYFLAGEKNTSSDST